MKAILVVDIPDGYGDVGDNKAIVTLHNGKLGTSLGIYNVPLKSVPQPKGYIDAIEWYLTEKDCTMFTDGWNACIGAIIGDTDGTKGKDCRDCIHWLTCACGKTGHEKGTSQGYSIGECRDFEEIEKCAE